MGPLVILQPSGDHDAELVMRRARLGERFTARWAARRLDEQLARGAAPEAGASLTLRTQILGDPRTRRALARSLRRVLDDARRGRRPGRARIPTMRAEVLAAAPELERIAELLAGPGLLGASGLAQVHLLLANGASPLYLRRVTNGLQRAAESALEGFDPGLEW
jgi:hypothetical protein